MRSQAPKIQLLDPSSGQTLAPRLTEIVNTAYNNEGPLWKIPNKPRTNIPELTAIIAASEIIAAFSGTTNEIIGCIQVHTISASSVAGLGMLAVSAAAQGQRVGRGLMDAAEAWAREKGFEEIQLEILMPKDFKLEPKEILAAWYGKLGYRVTTIATLGDYYPEKVPLLKCECDYVVYRKAL